MENKNEEERITLFRNFLSHFHDWQDMGKILSKSMKWTVPWKRCVQHAGTLSLVLITCIVVGFELVHLGLFTIVNHKKP